MGFYHYFRLADRNLPAKLRPFAPPVVYESARIMAMYNIDETASLQTFRAVYTKAYDNIVERIGYQAWLESHMQNSKK